MKEKPYVVSKGNDGRNEYYYCHMRGYPNIPVFGSIGDSRHAIKVCKMMNRSKGFE